MMCISPSNDGRIFLGGYDGNLYELTYQERNAFSLAFTKCSISNIDMGYGGAFIKQFSPGFASWLVYLISSK